MVVVAVVLVVLLVVLLDVVVDVVLVLPVVGLVTGGVVVVFVVSVLDLSRQTVTPLTCPDVCVVGLQVFGGIEPEFGLDVPVVHLAPV